MPVDGWWTWSSPKPADGGMAGADMLGVHAARYARAWSGTARSTHTRADLRPVRSLVLVRQRATAASSWFCDSSEGWVAGPRRVEHAAGAGQGRQGVTWRVRFVNHTAEIRGSARDRLHAADAPGQAQAEELPRSRPGTTRSAPAGPPATRPSPTTCRRSTSSALARAAAGAQGLARRPSGASGARTSRPSTATASGTERERASPALRRARLSDRTGVGGQGTYLFERHIRVGRRVGWRMTSTSRSASASPTTSPWATATSGAAGARARADALPWHGGLPDAQHARPLQAPGAHLTRSTTCPQRHHSWANNAGARCSSRSGGTASWSRNAAPSTAPTRSTW